MVTGEGVAVPGLEEEASGESLLVEHAHKIKVQRRSERNILCIENLRLVILP
jgi:hypothetical protein